MTKDEDFSIVSAFLQKKLRAAAKFVLKCWLFSLIIGLELILQFGLLLILIGLFLWVLILIILTSPLWIPLSILWAPAAIITFLAFRYTTEDDMEVLLQLTLMVIKNEGLNQIRYLKGEIYLTSLNCGYAILTQTGETLKLVAKKDKKQQFQFQMYHYAALGIKNKEDLFDQTVLDIGSGRGGGLAFLAQYFHPRLAVGIDISSNQINFSKTNQLEGENSENNEGDSENLDQIDQITKEQFDLVTCIESFHCFSNQKQVLKGISQKLDQNGSLVIADIFDKQTLPEIERLFSSLYRIDRQESITINVKHSMNLDKPRIEKLINSISENKIIVKILRNFFASAEGSKTFDELGKTKEYLCYVLKKQDSQDDSPVRNSSSKKQGVMSTNGNNMQYRNQNNQSNSSILNENDPQNQQQSI
eukprot:403331581